MTIQKSQIYSSNSDLADKIQYVSKSSITHSNTLLKGALEQKEPSIKSLVLSKKSIQSTKSKKSKTNSQTVIGQNDDKPSSLRRRHDQERSALNQEHQGIITITQERAETSDQKS